MMLLSQRVVTATLFLTLSSVSALECPLQANDNGDLEPIRLCAMCSDSNAAVRWTVIEDGKFAFLWLTYECEHPNGSSIYIYDINSPEDHCFKQYPSWDTSSTGSSAVGYELSTGMICKFRAVYRINRITTSKETNCTVKSPEMCAANPDECHVDRVSVMNEDDECPNYQCAEGHTGELCNNINECQTNNTCDDLANCHDTDGSYWCECWSGFQGDGYNCTDINECVNETSCNVNAECVNGVGNYSCQCMQGYTGDGDNCTNIDECATSNECSDHANCNDTDGSYWCECWSGFQGDGYNCTDINECVNETSCNVNAECVNSVGNYSCQCMQGYTGDGDNCTNIDECATSNECSDHANCNDTDGSYWCECWSGFQGDGYNCTDINECETVNETCSNVNAECVNSVGSYSCQCMQGYTGDGDNCTDIDECNEGLFICPNNSICVNVLGTYHCKNNDISADSQQAVVSGAVFGVLLLLFLVLLAVTVIVSHRYYVKKKKVLPFHELAKMELDPYYTPTFWKCSLSSIHSIYERLIFSENMMNKDDNNGSSGDSNQDDMTSINLTEQSEEGESEIQEHTGKCIRPSGPLNDHISISPYIPDHNVIKGQRGVSLHDSQASPHEFNTIPNTISARNYTFELTLPSIMLHSQENLQQEVHTSEGYIQECNALHEVTGSGTNMMLEDSSTQLQSGLSIVEHTTITCTTSDYLTESVISSDYDTQTCKSDTILERGNEEIYNNQCTSNTVGSSSGYATDSLNGEVNSPTITNCNIKPMRWDSRNSLKSDCTEETTDLDLDNIKFTVNPHQEFEYVNTVEEDFCKNISFDIVTQVPMES